MSFIRTTKPKDGDKYFIRQANGGYSTCITGKPTDPNCNVLANCVGYACGAFNEELELGYEKYHLSTNAENFIERAIACGLSVVKDPVVGGIMVWQKGATLSGSDGAGHVAICTAKPISTQVKTAESGYGSSAFWTATRNKGNGNWGAGTGYTYRGCIVNPKIGIGEVTPSEPSTPTSTPTPSTGLSDSELLDLVKRTIRGDFGNGETRKKKLGNNYSIVQSQVNKNIKAGLTRWDNIKLFK